MRILTNADMDAASPLACLLIGQPTLRRMLRLGVLAALDQRIALRYAMPAMTGEQTAGYITHHLKLAGRSDPLFSDDAAALIHDAARGLPRAVNNIATQALVAAWAGANPSSTKPAPAPPSPKSRQLTTTTPARTPRPRQHAAGGAVACPAHPHLQ